MSVRFLVTFFVACPLVFSGSLVFSGPIGAKEMRKGERKQPTPAAQFFAEAIAADAAGDAVLSGQLLQMAVQADPDFELARWHLGQVFFQGQWRSPKAVGQIVSRDARWVQYRERLQAASDTVEAHVELALSCRQAELENEEKWHWYQVLQAVPDHRQALGCLGVKRFQGGLYTTAEIEGIQQRQDQEQLDFKRYQREFKRLVHQARRGEPAERSKRLAQLSVVDDPAAIPALFDQLVKVNREHKQATGSEGSTEEIPDVAPFDEQVGKAVVIALSNIRQHDATLRLLDIAMLAESRSVRRNAALALRYREPTSYMPLLMSFLTAPIELDLKVLVLPSGQISLIEEVYQEGPTSRSHEVRSSRFLTPSFPGTPTVVTKGKVTGRETVSREGADLNSPSGLRRLAADRTRNTRRAAARIRATQRAEARIVETQQRVAQENLVRSQRNTRIKEVLQTTTDQQLGDDPKTWWTAWQQYNELYVPETLPVYKRNSYEDVAFRSVSCFIAGTPVWTQAGPVAIEQIQTGDLVLSQDPISGRLDYRPVIDTTIRPPSSVVALAVNNETITTTLGHRFWVTGKGWRMAKLLAAGDRLFSPSGSNTLQSTSTTPEATAYNLVVGEYHTYFVGQSRLLVHDNNCPQPTVAALPGVSVDSWE